MPTTDECGLAQQLNILVVYKKNIALNLTLFMRQEIHYHTFPQHFTRILRFLNFRFVEEYLTGVAGNLFSQKSCTLHHLVFGLYVCVCCFKSLYKALDIFYCHILHCTSSSLSSTIYFLITPRITSLTIVQSYSDNALKSQERQLMSLLTWIEISTSTAVVGKGMFLNS